MAQVLGCVGLYWGQFNRSKNTGDNDNNVITTEDWVIVYLIMCIPLVNIIMLFV